MSKTPLFVKIARPSVRAFLQRHYHIQTKGLDAISQVDGPFLVLSNHVHVLDPFFISAIFPHHIRWVAGSYLVKNPLLGFVLRSWVKVLSKQQGRSDLQTIREITRALKNGDVVGLFPEGTRTWDGEALPFNASTAKLVKLLQVPVVCINLEGGYMLKPRWASFPRRGKLTIRVFPPLGVDTITQMPTGDLATLISDRLSFSNRVWTKRKSRIFPAQGRRAEGLQRLLYLCPSCGARSALVTAGDTVECSQCALTVRLDAHDQLHVLQGACSFNDVSAWHSWEQQELAKLALASAGKADEPLFPPDTGTLLQIGRGMRFITLTRRFELSLTQRSIILCRRDKRGGSFLGASRVLEFPFSDIQSVIIAAKGSMELFLNNILYRIRIDESACILKYLEYYQMGKNLVQVEEVE